MYVCQIPFEQQKAIAATLDANNDWEKLGRFFKFLLCKEASFFSQQFFNFCSSSNGVQR